jgi:adenine nucleotide transporter 17
MHLKNNESSQYKSILDGLKKIVKQEGIKGLYKGIESKLVQSVLTAAFTFAFKEQLFNGSVWLLVLLKLRAKQGVPIKA